MSTMKWRVRRFDNDPETEPASEARTLASAVGRAQGIDERFRKGTKDADGSYHDARTGVVIERIEPQETETVTANLRSKK